MSEYRQRTPELTTINEQKETPIHRHTHTHTYYYKVRFGDKDFPALYRGRKKGEKIRKVGKDALRHLKDGIQGFAA